MTLTLKHLRYFAALAQHKHFLRAAEASRISQPALSIQIKDMEEVLGYKLIERQRGHIELSELGLKILPRVHDILRAVDELEEFTRSEADSMLGRIRLGLIPTIAPYMLPFVIRTLKGHSPHLELSAREAVTHKLVEELKRGELDMAIVALPLGDSYLVEQPLFTEPFLFISSAQETFDTPPHLSDLHHHRVLLLEEGHCFREQAISLCQLPSVMGRNELDASSLSTLVQMVAAGMGVTVIPSMAVSLASGLKDVCISAFSEPAPARTVGLVWRKDSYMHEKYLEISKSISLFPTYSQHT